MRTEAQLLRLVMEEIKGLRAQNARLAAYHDHTERLLAMFEGGPRQESSMGMAEDVCWLIQQRLTVIEEPRMAEDTKSDR